jgi:hypothetical protein
MKESLKRQTGRNVYFEARWKCIFEKGIEVSYFPNAKYKKEGIIGKCSLNCRSNFSSCSYPKVVGV